jgi:hypothetical protein
MHFPVFICGYLPTDKYNKHPEVIKTRWTEIIRLMF